MPRKKYLDVTERIAEFDLDDTFDSHRIQDIVEWLQELREQHSEYRSMWFSVERGWDDAADTLELMGTRSETDEERNHRLDVARKERAAKAERKARREEAEREEYERLKAKFEGVDHVS